MLDNRFHSPVDDDRIAGRFVPVAAAFLIAASTVSREYIFVKLFLYDKNYFYKRDTNKKSSSEVRGFESAKKYRDPWDSGSR